MTKKYFNKDDLNKIEQAVKQSESKTSGEIATAFIKESYDYAVYELLFAVFCGFVYFVVTMVFSAGIEEILENMFWDYSNQYLLMFYGLSTFLVIFICYLIANFAIFDRLIVPRSVMKSKVNERAVRYFMESGVYDTRDRTGILIFISFLEKRVELLADKGISEKIPVEKWHELVNHIIKGIKDGQLVPNLTESIRQCGDLLAQHFPIRPDDENELKDGIEILEK